MITFILLISFITKDFAHYEINSIQLEREILHVQQGDLISNILLQVDPEINHNWEIKIDPGIYAESQLHLVNINIWINSNDEANPSTVMPQNVVGQELLNIQQTYCQLSYLVLLHFSQQSEYALIVVTFDSILDLNYCQFSPNFANNQIVHISPYILLETNTQFICNNSLFNQTSFFNSGTIVSSGSIIRFDLENSSFDEISRQEGLGNAIDIQVNKDTTGTISNCFFRNHNINNNLNYNYNKNEQEQQEKHWKSAVNIRYGKLNLINSQFVGCIGGALSIHSSNVEIDSDTTFSDNYSGRDGYNSEMRNIICQGEGSSISATSESFIDSFAKGNQKSYFIIADTYCILSQEFSNITSVNVVPIISSAESEELEGFNQVRFDIQGQRFISNDTQDLDTLLPGSRIAEVSFSLYGFEFHPVIDNESMEIITGTLNYNQNNSSDTAIHIQSSNEVIQTHIIPEKIYWENDSSVIFDLPTQMFVNLSGGFWELRLLYGHNGCTPWVTIFNNTYSTTDTKNKKDAVLIISIIFAVIGLLALFYLTIFLYFYCFKWKPLNTQTPEQRMQLEHSRSLIMEPYKSGDNLAKLVKEVKDDNNDDEFSYKNQTNIQEIQESRSPITPEYKNGSQFSRGSSPKSVITIKSPTMTPSASFNYLEKFMPQNSSRFGSLRNANKVMVVQQGGETQNLYSAGKENLQIQQQKEQNNTDEGYMKMNKSFQEIDEQLFTDLNEDDLSPLQNKFITQQQQPKSQSQQSLMYTPDSNKLEDHQYIVTTQEKTDEQSNEQNISFFKELQNDPDNSSVSPQHITQIQIISPIENNQQQQEQQQETVIEKKEEQEKQQKDQSNN